VFSRISLLNVRRGGVAAAAGSAAVVAVVVVVVVVAAGAEGVTTVAAGAGDAGSALGSGASEGGFFARLIDASIVARVGARNPAELCGVVR
jgi:hypothetical protein